MQAGSSANIIPDEAVLQLNIRMFDDQVREQVLASIKRIVDAEAAASGAPKPPTITTLPGEFPLTINDEEATRTVAQALLQRFGAERVRPTGPTSASEDFSVIPRAWNVPSVYWIVAASIRRNSPKRTRPGD
jgi:hippurate hydrolase